MKRAFNYPSQGNGTNSHISAELFKNLTGANLVHVPYKGGGPALIAVLSGEADLAILGIDVVMSHVRTGRLRALAVTSTDAPTVAEAGVPDYEFASWYGVLAPAGTPVSVINVLNGNIAKAVHTPELAERFAQEGTDVIGESPAQFASHIKTELARWAEVVKGAGLRAD